MRAAFFDLDRTILNENSGKSWIQFQYREKDIGKMYVAKAVYWQILYRAALLDMESLARRLVRDVEGDLEKDMIAKCNRWIEGDLVKLISPAAVDEVKKHQEAGTPVVMITGASQFTAHPIAEKLGIEHVLCSELEVVDGVFTGEIAQMCFGEHKVPIAEKLAAKEGIDLSRSIFYTDSYNDLPLLNRVEEGVVVNADARLLREAKRRGWRIENWATA